MTTFTVQMDTPYLSFEEYARRAGISLHLVRRQASEGKLPLRAKTKPKDKPFINMVALYQEALTQAQTALSA